MTRCTPISTAVYHPEVSCRGQRHRTSETEWQIGGKRSRIREGSSLGMEEWELPVPLEPGDRSCCGNSNCQKAQTNRLRKAMMTVLLIVTEPSDVQTFTSSALYLSSGSTKLRHSLTTLTSDAFVSARYFLVSTLVL